MMVLDASAAATIVRDGGASSARQLLAECDKIVAPEFLCVEIANVAWKYAHAGKLDKEGALEYMRLAISCVDEFHSNSTLAEEALAEAIRLGHSFYDMLYFVLARRCASPLLTCDRRLAKICNDNNVECIELIDFAKSV